MRVDCRVCFLPQTPSISAVWTRRKPTSPWQVLDLPRYVATFRLHGCGECYRSTWYILADLEVRGVKPDFQCLRGPPKRKDGLTTFLPLRKIPHWEVQSSCDEPHALLDLYKSWRISIIRWQTMTTWSNRMTWSKERTPIPARRSRKSLDIFRGDSTVRTCGMNAEWLPVENMPWCSATKLPRFGQVSAD